MLNFAKNKFNDLVLEKNQVKKRVQVCFSPALFPLYADRESIVVVADVLRATSSMCYAFEKGVRKMIPVSTVEEALEFKNHKDHIIAAERNGKIVEGFDFGNSPQTYDNINVDGKVVVMTTTNGTKTISIAKKDHEVIVGSFLNLDAISDYLIGKDKNVILVCAGWKDKFNLEDTLFCGAVVEQLLLSGNYFSECDSAYGAKELYKSSEDDLYAFLEVSSHRKRLQNLDIDSDVKFCLQKNITSHVPLLQDDYLISTSSLIEKI